MKNTEFEAMNIEELDLVTGGTKSFPTSESFKKKCEKVIDTAKDLGITVWEKVTSWFS